MKNKIIALLCATMLSICCVGLAACGGSASSASGSASGSASASASSAADPTAKFVGDWKLAGAKKGDLTVAGDFSMIFGSNAEVTLTVKDDGTATMALAGEERNLTWEAKDDNTITMKPVLSEESSDSSASASAASESASAASESASAASAESQEVAEIEAVFENDALVVKTDATSSVDSMIFTADGTMADMPEISADKAEKITDGDAVIGTWTLSAANMMGATMYGDLSSISSLTGSSSTTDMTLTFNKDGSAEMSGSSLMWEIDDKEGLVVGADGVMIPVKSLGDDIALDMSSMAGTELIMVYSK